MKAHKHAEIQAQRRAISPDLIDFIIENGTPYKAGKGCHMFRVEIRELPFMKSECQAALWNRIRDKLNHISPVVDCRETVITAMHRYKNIRKN